MYELFLIAHLMLCVCCSYDLWASIKNPLQSANKRRLKYGIVILVTIILLFVIQHELIDGSIYKAMDINFKEYDISWYILKNNHSWKILLLLPMLLNLIYGTNSCYRAWKSFDQPGLGQNIRIKVIKRQMAFVVITILCNGPTTITSIYKNIKDNMTHDGFDSILENENIY